MQDPRSASELSGVMLESARPVHSSATRPMVKVGSVAVRRLTSLHGQNGLAPDAVDHVLAQIVRKRVDLASTVSNEVNVVGAVQAARTPGHEDHLDDVGDSQVIAAHDLNIPKRRPPGLPYFAAMHETFAPARLVAHPVTGGDPGIRGETAEHALLAPDPADVLDAMHRYRPVVAPRQPLGEEDGVFRNGYRALPANPVAGTHEYDRKGGCTQVRGRATPTRGDWASSRR
jgi:hypothetical protein